MKRVFQIGHNDIRLFLRMKAGYVWLFLVPLVFVYFFGIAFRGPGAPSNPRPAVLIENRDTGFLGTLLMGELDAQGMRLVDQAKRNEAERGIRIPADFTGKVLKTEPVKVEFFQVEGSGAESAFLIELRLIRALVAMNSHLFELASQSQEPVNEPELRALTKAENPVSLKAQFAGRNPAPAGFNQSLPGTLVQFLMMNLMIFGGASIAGERADGVLRRLAVYPIRRWELVIGKVYGRFLLGGVQIIFFLLLGQFIFKVNLGQSLFAILLTLGIYAWVAASLGVDRRGGEERGQDHRPLRAGKLDHGGAWRMLVAFGNRAGNVANHRSLCPDRLGDGCAASTDQLRRRLGNGPFQAWRAGVVRRRREHRRGEDVQILKCTQRSSPSPADAEG